MPQTILYRRARLFERNLRLTVVNLQQKLKIAAKSMLDEYKLQCKDQKLSAVEEASAMIKDQMQVINQVSTEHVLSVR